MLYNTPSIADSAKDLAETLREFMSAPNSTHPEKISSAVQSLRGSLENDKIAELYLQGIEKLTMYMQTSHGNAHPLATSVLLSFGSHFADYLQDDSKTPEQKKQILLGDVAEFTKLKSELEKAESPETASSPSTSPAVKGAVRDLKIVILSIDWEIGDEVLQTFRRTLSTLDDLLKEDRILSAFVRVLSEIQEYLSRQRAAAHPDTFKILQSFHTGLEESLLDSTSETTKKALLVERLKEFDSFKRNLTGFVSDSTQDSSPIEADAVDKAFVGEATESLAIPAAESEEIDQHVENFFGSVDDSAPITAEEVVPDAEAEFSGEDIPPAFSDEVLKTPSSAAEASAESASVVDFDDEPMPEALVPEPEAEEVSDDSEPLQGVVDDSSYYDDGLDYDGESEIPPAFEDDPAVQAKAAEFIPEDKVAKDLDSFFGESADAEPVNVAEVEAEAQSETSPDLAGEQVEVIDFDSDGDTGEIQTSTDEDLSEFEDADIPPAFSEVSVAEDPEAATPAEPVPAEETSSVLESTLDDFFGSESELSSGEDQSAVNTADISTADDDEDLSEFDNEDLAPAFTDEDAAAVSNAPGLTVSSEVESSLDDMFGTDDNDVEAPASSESAEKATDAPEDISPAPAEDDAATLASEETAEAVSAVTDTEAVTAEDEWSSAVDAAWNDREAFEARISAELEAADETTGSLLQALQASVALADQSESYREAADALAMALDLENDISTVAVAFSKFAVATTSVLSAPATPTEASASVDTEKVEAAIKLLQESLTS